MALTQSPSQSQLDSSQATKAAHHQQFGVTKVMSGFLAGQVGRKIEISAVNATTNDIFFKQDSELLMTYRVIYDNAAHDNLLSAERIT